MGFKAPRTIYKLTFADPDLEGLEVRARAASTEIVFRIGQLNHPDDTTTPREIIAWFADHLVSWNLEDDAGTPVPLTTAGLLTQEQGFVRSLVASWVTATSGVSDPLEQPSSGGEPSAEASIPMETLSENRAS